MPAVMQKGLCNKKRQQRERKRSISCKSGCVCSANKKKTAEMQNYYSLTAFKQVIMQSDGKMVALLAIRYYIFTSYKKGSINKYCLFYFLYLCIQHLKFIIQNSFLCPVLNFWRMKNAKK